jgi:hypothetical protein
VRPVPTSAPGQSSSPSYFASATTLERTVKRIGLSFSRASSPKSLRHRLDTDYTYNAGYEPTSDRSLKNVLASNKRVLQRCRVLTGSARHIA